MNRLLDKFKGGEFIGVKELSDAAVEILRQVGPSQEKANVAEFPNERTVRYYLTEGLLPQPSDKRSQASVFGYEHLVTLIAIKKLQADGLPISVIRTLLADKSIGELEALLDEPVTVFTDRQSLETFQQQTRSDEPVVEIPAETSRKTVRNEAKSFLESLLSKKKKTTDEIDFGDIGSAASIPMMAFSMERSPQEPDVEEWKRYELAPGLELHVEKKFRPPDGKRETQKILDAIKKILRM